MGVNGANVVQELDLHVTWKENGVQRVATVSTLVYQKVWFAGRCCHEPATAPSH